MSSIAVGTVIAHRPPGHGNGPLPLVSTERDVRISRATLFGSWCTAPRVPTVPYKGVAVLVAVAASVVDLVKSSQVRASAAQLASRSTGKSNPSVNQA